MSVPGSPHEALASGTVLAGRYRVERQLGKGGMGAVYLVQHVHTDERFALKLLHETVVKDQMALDRFRREARTPARIDSDHVVRVTDADVAPELGNVPFLVMEYLRGEDLDRLSNRRGPLPPAEVVLYLSQAARALDKAHNLGIVHRDLKPENLFLTTREDGTPCVKILDFGIAKMTGGDLHDAGRITSTGQIFGTPLYMSPEQALGESARISTKTDVWALGLIAHRLLHGAEFWAAEHLTQLIAMICFQPMVKPSARGSTLGDAYDAWFARVVNRSSDERIASAGEAVRELAAALRVSDVQSAVARVPMSIRTSDPGAWRDTGKDAFAETSVTAATAPSAPSVKVERSSDAQRDEGADTSASNMHRTQFGAETGAHGRRKPRLGLAIGAIAVVIACGVGAYFGLRSSAIVTPLAAEGTTTTSATTAPPPPTNAPDVRPPPSAPASNEPDEPTVSPATTSTAPTPSTGGRTVSPPKPSVSAIATATPTPPTTATPTATATAKPKNYLDSRQ